MKEFPAAGRRRAASPSLASVASTFQLESLAAHEPLENVQKGPPPFLSGMPPWDSVYEPTQPITRRLAKIIAKYGYAEAFDKAIARVGGQGIPELSLVHSLDQFFFYLDALVQWIPEIRRWEQDGQTMHERTVYLRIIQLYYYFNQPELEALQSPIAPGGDALTPISEWLRDFAVDWGAFLDTPASAAKLASFRYAPEYTWQDYEKPPEDYATFNAFFAREFDNIDTLRPVAAPEDDRTIVFPAESTFVGQWAVSTPVGDPMPADPSITVKHIQWSIKELLADSEHADCFQGGLFCHSFLNTFDYHRLHAPVAGKVLEAKFIPGQVYLQVDLQQQDPDAPENGGLANAIIPQRYLNAEDPTGYQFVQCRGLLVLETEAFGKVAVLPMGMAQVSSVVFTGPGGVPITLTEDEKAGCGYLEQVEKLNAKIAAVNEGRWMEKGEMFSFFQFGGSDCVMVFERRANVSVTAQVGVHYPIRSRYAVAAI
ncbi:phosphatidylserine decarboxylase [Rhodovulum sp. DZ06]|uniref:phosphatidylserine decarboxylase n=1 Tax=Rhodovulum sp. DZ06 TaxID=3425126 RepID=UPI003D33EE5C